MPVWLSLIAVAALYFLHLPAATNALILTVAAVALIFHFLRLCEKQAGTVKSGAKTSTSTAAHSRLRPSAARRWMRCTASPALIEKIAPPETTSAAAAKGQRLHEIIESCLRSGRMPEDADKNQVAIVQRALELFAPLRGDFDDWRYEETLYTRIAEEKIGGTIDALGVNRRKNRVCVLDWKFGSRVMQARDNPQLLLYALMAGEYFAESSAADIGVFDLCIVQPGVQKKINRAEYTAAELESFRRKLEPLVEQIRTGQGVFQVHPDACRFCPVKQHCPEMQSATAAG